MSSGSPITRDQDGLRVDRKACSAVLPVEQAQVVPVVRIVAVGRPAM